uniref:Uncharacterized protein n=1 Tax=Anguilla anguilla TaxID=7936 RepID=A0A0E9TWR1_ANGAN
MGLLTGVTSVFVFFVCHYCHGGKMKSHTEE